MTAVAGLPAPWGLRTDPRTKLALLLLVVLAVALSPGWRYELGVMAATAVFAVVSGRLYPLAMFAVYALAVLGISVAGGLAPGTLTTMLVTFFVMIRKVFPCALMAAVLVSTTRIDELMAALGRLRAPRALVIPLAVTLRYVPVVVEDWRFIRDAMRMRGISPTPWGLLRAPGRTMQCLYVPMLMSASSTADELSMASVARGIENPVRRTCLTELRLRTADVVVLVAGVAVVAGALVPGASG
ncbi:MAG TPA: energy-coupling factor transporter transmembrane component T [Cellulomonas sp.]